jgi:hypothetical protein
MADGSAEDAYSSMVPDPTFGFVGGPRCSTLDFVIVIAFWIMITFYTLLTSLFILNDCHKAILLFSLFVNSLCKMRVIFLSHYFDWIERVFFLSPFTFFNWTTVCVIHCLHYKILIIRTISFSYYCYSITFSPLLFKACCHLRSYVTGIVWPPQIILFVILSFYKINKWYTSTLKWFDMSSMNVKTAFRSKTQN